MSPNTSFSQKLTFHARRSMKEARDIARYTRSRSVEPEHLLLAIFLESGSLGSHLLENMGFEKEKLASYCLKKKSEGKSFPPSTVVSASESTKSIVHRAYAIAHQFHFPYVGTEHIVYALIESDAPVLDEIFLALEIDERRIESALNAHLNFDHFPQLAKMFEAPAEALGSRTQGKLAALRQYGEELTFSNRAADRHIVSGRDAEVERMVQILLRRHKSNPLLIGEPGVGKTALVTHLAERISLGEVPEDLLGKRIFAVDLALVVAGTNFRGEFEARLKDILREAEENPEVILFIDEVHTAIGAGNTSGGLDAANILKPALARGDIQCIGATTLTEYKRHIEKDPALERRFQNIHVEEPAPELAKLMLRNAKGGFEAYHGVKLSNAIVDLAVDLSNRHLPDRYLPDKAFDLIDEASTLAKQSAPDEDAPALRRATLRLRIERLKERKDASVSSENFDEAARLKSEQEAAESALAGLQEERRRNRGMVTVGEEHLFRTLSRISGIPESKLALQDPEPRYRKLVSALQTQVIGQDEALETLNSVFLRSLSNIHDPRRPLGSLLFLGPSGTGKTLTARVIAREFFGDERALIRLDMSEFMERHSVAQIIGAPAGYVGYGEGGKLTEAIRRRPHSVVLFDEIEKAHPDVFHILLQILDEGTLTDAEGRRVSFKNALIILTSNIGSHLFASQGSLGFAHGAQSLLDAKKSAVLAELRKTLRPELLARIEHTILFNPITKTSLNKIARRELAALQSRLKERGLRLVVGRGVAAFVAGKSASPDQGARLVRKVIQETIERPLAEAIIASPESKTFSISLSNGNVVCRPKTAVRTRKHS